MQKAVTDNGGLRVSVRGYGFDYTGGIAYRNGIGRYIMSDHTAGTNGTIVANGDTGKDSDGASDPDITADGDRLSPLHASVALNGVGAVTSSENTDIRTNETIVTNGNESLIEDSKTEIGEEAFADANMPAIVAVERLIDKSISIGSTEHLLQHGVAGREIGGQEIVVLLTESLDVIEFDKKVGVASIIELACKHFLFLGHREGEWGEQVKG